MQVGTPSASKVQMFDDEIGSSMGVVWDYKGCHCGWELSV